MDLIERVAAAMYRAPDPDDPDVTVCVWPPSHPIDVAWWLSRAQAAINAVYQGVEMDVSTRCKTCGWLISDIDGHLDAMYEDHVADHPAKSWADRHGDVWVLGDDSLLHSRETASFPRERVEKKWGPLIPHPTKESDDA